MVFYVLYKCLHSYESSLGKTLCILSVFFCLCESMLVYAKVKIHTSVQVCISFCIVFCYFFLFPLAVT